MADDQPSNERSEIRNDSKAAAGLREDIRAGFEAVERAEYDDYDEHTTKALALDIKARGRAALATEKQTVSSR